MKARAGTADGSRGSTARVEASRSFIAYLEDSLHTQKIVRSVMDMATSLDLQSIGEGIETYGQVALLRSLGCELGQGFLFSRPASPRWISELLREEAAFAVDPDGDGVGGVAEDGVEPDGAGDAAGTTATVTPIAGRGGRRAASSH